ncbi:hypothetical protein [Roseibium sp. RKSG952]|uniref:hypothetical protein n=1 Tax=Roseibium sp. RKSG952 TaxID=2529384 RepID=UPI0012BC7369|nr:hypothetical protein [Roseibium sp. RKSG952]MTH95133.1 hypothetical protein [Roseibium sp. RKSG952]
MHLLIVRKIFVPLFLCFVSFFADSRLNGASASNNFMPIYHASDPEFDSFIGSFLQTFLYVSGFQVVDESWPSFIFISAPDALSGGKLNTATLQDEYKVLVPLLEGIDFKVNTCGIQRVVYTRDASKLETIVAINNTNENEGASAQGCFFLALGFFLGMDLSRLQELTTPEMALSILHFAGGAEASGEL